MKPKEKAQELYKKFGLGGWGKEHALTCVKEIIKQKPSEPREYNSTLGYWEEVIQEIEKL